MQKTGRAEPPTEINAVSQRPEKETCPKLHEGKKAGGNRNVDRNQASSSKTFLQDFKS